MNAKVDDASIASLMEGCDEHASIFITGPTEIIGPQLEEAGIEHTVVDWKAKGEAHLKANNKKAYKKYMKDKAKAEKKKEKEGEDT